MLIYVRHGERLDQVDQIPEGMSVDFPYDPQMTPKGMEQAAAVANLVKTFLDGKGYTAPGYTFVSSPHFRTMQTAASFTHEFT